MSRLSEHLLVVLVTLWVGAMWSVGYVVAPTLFGMIGDRTLAGNVAGRLFTLVAWIGLASAAYLLAFQLLRQRWRALRSGLFWVVVAMALMTLTSQFGIQPLMAQMKADAWPREVMNSVLRDRFATWHGVSSVLYLVQSVLGIVLALGARRLLR
jgi:hypothetical protein